jgi:hypothetical protein
MRRTRGHIIPPVSKSLLKDAISQTPTFSFSHTRQTNTCRTTYVHRVDLVFLGEIRGAPLRAAKGRPCRASVGEICDATPATVVASFDRPAIPPTRSLTLMKSLDKDCFFATARRLQMDSDPT